jgi:hypothetical protein
MRTDTPAAALAAVSGRAAAVSGPRLEITPSEAQYEQLCRDLATLRKSGAPSHTAAIIQAVHAAAAGNLGRDGDESAGRR